MVGGEDLHLARGGPLAPGVVPHQLDGVGLDVGHREFSHLQRQYR